MLQALTQRLIGTRGSRDLSPRLRRGLPPLRTGRARRARPRVLPGGDAGHAPALEYQPGGRWARGRHPLEPQPLDVPGRRDAGLADRRRDHRRASVPCGGPELQSGRPGAAGEPGGRHGRQAISVAVGDDLPPGPSRVVTGRLPTCERAADRRPPAPLPNIFETTSALSEMPKRLDVALVDQVANHLVVCCLNRSIDADHRM